MRGRRSVFSRLGVLEQHAVHWSRRPAKRARLDLSMLSDDELEVLATLAETAEAAGGKPVWTPEEATLLAALEARVVVIPEMIP